MYNDSEYFFKENKREIERAVQTLVKTVSSEENTFFRDTTTGLLEALEPSEFQKFLEEQLKDPEFKREWDLLEPERIKIRKEIESQRKLNN